MSDSKIEWTDATWNPVTGCTKISPGCDLCYAERFAKRLRAMGVAKYDNDFEVTLHADVLEAPLTWKRPRRIFVDSMSDLFHEAVPETFIRQVFTVMKRANWHQFQILTKRSRRLANLGPQLEWAPNIWVGVSVETADYLGRIDDLRSVPAHIKFVSFEPLIGPLQDLQLSEIDWVIVGGESGPGARPMEPEWARHIRDTCVGLGIPFFFKQWGGQVKKKAGRVLDGRTWDEMPAA